MITGGIGMVGQKAVKDEVKDEGITTQQKDKTACQQTQYNSVLLEAVLADLTWFADTMSFI